MIKPRKVRLEEKLIELEDFQSLKDTMKNEELRNFLNTPFKELLDKGNELGHTYTHAFGGAWAGFYKKPLIDVLRFVTGPGDDGSRVKFYLSEGKGIEGLIFYTLYGSNDRWPGIRTHVGDICALSFNLGRNSYTLAKDLFTLILKLREECDYINWLADKNNPACRTYKAICNKYNGSYGPSKEHPEAMLFWIPGVHNETYNHLTKTPEPLEERSIPIIGIANDLLNEDILNFYKERNKRIEEESHRYDAFFEWAEKK